MPNLSGKIFTERLKNLIYLIFPKGKQEIGIFLFFLLFYFSYSIILALKSSVIDHEGGIVDLYFGFDNSHYYNAGEGIVSRHPLLGIFGYPFQALGNILQSIFGYKGKTVMFMLLCNFCISLSVIYIYRYLREVIQLTSPISVLLCFFYGLIPSNLILSFTVESFTLSAVILPFVVYYFSIRIKKDIPISTTSIVCLSIIGGGVTTTNFIKILAPVLFFKENLGSKIKKLLITGICFFVVFIFVILLKGLSSGVYSDSVGYIVFPGLFDQALNILNQFLGAPLLLPKLRIHNGYGYNTIMMYLYDSWWQYISIGIIYIGIILSISRNLKNRLLWLLISTIALDILLHCIIGFGLVESFIYSGHWVYALPLLLGWLCKSLNGKKSKYIFLFCFICLFSIITINNIYRLSEFVILSINYIQNSNHIIP